jgi:hypothetical protein
MRSWIRLENREYNQFDNELEDDKDMLCVAFFRLRLSLLRIVGLSLLLLVIGRCGIICKGFETERDADLIGLFEAYAFFHGGAMGLTMVHAQDTVTTLYLAIFMSSFSLWPHHETLVYVDKRD